MSAGVAAIVVTYNRKALLLQCLGALLGADRQPDRIYVIDNACDDGTPEALADAGLLANELVRYVRLERNSGGAGGFMHGVELAHRDGFEWLWLMDDDCIVRRDSLQQLLDASGRLPTELRPDLLCSRVLAEDGRDHPMNWAAPRWRLEFGHERELSLRCTAHAVMSVRCCSFVSVLIHRRAVDRVGLPRGEFFLWSDDIDYTARVCNRAIGVQVPDSIVDHKAKRYGTLDATPERFFYHIRNQRAMLRDERAFSGIERRARQLALVVDSLRWLAKAPWRPARWSCLIRGLTHSVRGGNG